MKKLLLIFIIFLIPLVTGQSCTDTDSDLGHPERLGVVGTCVDAAGSFTDFCSDGRLTEYYCGPLLAPLNCKSTSYPCTSWGYGGCSNGACTPTCTDTDTNDTYKDGKNYYEKGTCTALATGWSGDDFCTTADGKTHLSTGSHVYEYFCNVGGCGVNIFECLVGYTCQDGACVEGAPTCTDDDDCPTGYYCELFTHTCEVRPHRCVGTIPMHSEVCPGDYEGLTAETQISLVDTCNGEKCEYICETGFVKSGEICHAETVCTDDDDDGYDSCNPAGDPIAGCDNPCDCDDNAFNDLFVEEFAEIYPSSQEDCDIAISSWAVCINPGATEICDDGIDNDCDGDTDTDDTDCAPPTCPTVTSCEEYTVAQCTACIDPCYVLDEACTTCPDSCEGYGTQELCSNNPCDLTPSCKGVLEDPDDPDSPISCTEASIYTDLAGNSWDCSGVTWGPCIDSIRRTTDVCSGPEGSQEIKEISCRVTKKFPFSSSTGIIIALVLLVGYYVFVNKKDNSNLYK